MTDDRPQTKEIMPNVAVHMKDFPIVSFSESMLPVGRVVDDKGGKVCHNVKEARKYAGQQFERLITKSLNNLYEQKNVIATLEISDSSQN